MPQGTIKLLVPEQGFGIIAGADGEHYFHRTALVASRLDAVRPGQTVLYDLEQGYPERPRATNVRPQ